MYIREQPEKLCCQCRKSGRHGRTTWSLRNNVTISGPEIVYAETNLVKVSRWNEISAERCRRSRKTRVYLARLHGNGVANSITFLSTRVNNKIEDGGTIISFFLLYEQDIMSFQYDAQFIEQCVGDRQAANLYNKYFPRDSYVIIINVIIMLILNWFITANLSKWAKRR